MELKNNIWVFIELVEGKPSQLSLELLGKGRQLADSRNDKLVALLAGKGAADAAKDVIGCGADVAFILTNPELDVFDSVLYTAAVRSVISKYEANVLLIGASHDGRDLGGRLSAAMNLGLVADCIDCSYENGDSLTWVRPAYTGKVFVKILTTTRPQLATIGERIFRNNIFDPGRTGEVMEDAVSLDAPAPTLKVTKFEALPPLDPDADITTADFVVGAGRGVGDEEGLAKVKAFADAIGAPLGVSKPLVDNGWAPYDQQIGVTGASIQASIYVALGISGAIQHRLGLKDVGLIIAVNNDPNAPIFRFAHYGIVGDLFAALPVLEEELKKLKV